jgi:hypothetical protein
MHNITQIVSDEREKTLSYRIMKFPPSFDVCFKNRDTDQSTDIPVDTEVYGGTSKLGGKDDKEPIDQSNDRDIEHIVEGEVEATDLNDKDETMSLICYLSHFCMSAIHVGFNYNGTQGVVFHILCAPMLPKYNE